MKVIDNMKLRFDLVPLLTTAAIAEVFTYVSSVGKYADEDWQERWPDDDENRTNQKSAYYSAAQRHFDAWWALLEDEDAESKLHPLKHVLANVAVLLWFETHE